MAKRTLTDRLINSLKPAPTGKRYEIMDGVVPGFGVRVTDKGKRTFVLVARYPTTEAPANPTRRAIGAVGAVALAQARDRARDWLELIRQGIDPAVHEERRRRAEIQTQQTSFEAVAEEFIARKLSLERKGPEATRDLRREFIKPWARRPVTDISEGDVLAVIRAKAVTAPAQARNLLGLIKRFFNWAIAQRSYGLTTSPCRELRPTAIVGEKRTGDRILNDDELVAFWRAAKRLPYPYGPAYQLLALTALRVNEVADANWTEFDRSVDRAIQDADGAPIDWTMLSERQRAWTIPAARMKGRNGKARAHVVPLTTDALTLLEKLPRLGRYLFSTTGGEKPVWLSDKIKKRLDQRMLRTLRAMARSRGEDFAAVRLPAWTNHDIRRTVRSNLSRLRIPEEAREAVLAHARPGIKGTYDLYDYFDEKREALDLWAARLRAITTPPPSNVLKFSVSA